MNTTIDVNDVPTETTSAFKQIAQKNLLKEQ